MYKLLSWLLLLSPVLVYGQVFPKEGAALHYRLIGFSFPSKQGGAYRLEIAAGRYNNDDSFSKKIVTKVEGDNNRVIAEVPEFGRDYTWRVVYDNKKKTTSPFYHFSTKMNSRVDTSMLRMRPIQAATGAYKDYYIGVDAGGVLYDMNGKAIWYIPDTNGYGGNVADWKFTSTGSMTFIYKNLFEINYNGDVLWTSPKRSTMIGDTALGELYHHEFKKLSNGHYMALGMQFAMCKTVYDGDSARIVLSDGDWRKEKPGYRQGKFGCLIEYDPAGNIVWSWRSMKYLLNADLAYFAPTDSNTMYDAHDNSFFFDERNKSVYVGFKNIGRIVKVGYPSGNVLGMYGKSLKPGGGGEDLFCHQHSIGRTMDGLFYYFNNNSCRAGSPPSIVMLQEPATEGGALKKVWEYNCVADGKFNQYFSNGGNAIELPDRSIFINMGSKYSKLLIINRDKEVLWSAMPERYAATDAKWIPNYEYRANLISRKDLEKMIWEAQITGSSK